jgi:hypothetical protein
VQRALRAGDADVHQAALFLDAAVGLRFAVRQNAFLDTDQEDVLELQTLGGVQGRQLDGIGVASFLSSMLIRAMVCVRSISVFPSSSPSCPASRRTPGRSPHLRAPPRFVLRS